MNPDSYVRVSSDALPVQMWVGIESIGLCLCESFYQMAAALPAIP